MVTVVSIAKKQCSCKKCNSTLEYTFQDIQKYEINHDYLGDFDIVTGIKCPICNTVNKVK